MLRNDIYRIVDANINRASEALRVLEDWSRFIKEDSLTSQKLKNIRHKLNSIYLSIPNLVFNRESTNDLGRNIENTTKRKCLRDILSANCKRAEEALRVLSEYGQLIGLDIKNLEESRYEVYTLEKELLKKEKLIRLNNAKLYLITNRDNFNSDKEFLDTIKSSIEGGVNIIQLREKNESGKNILKLSKDIKEIIANINPDVLFIMNDRVDIALACNADGVHLGQDDLPISEARKITPDGFIIGLSTHSIDQGTAGLKSEADYLGVGPVFETPTKPSYKPVGLEYVKWAKDNLINIPWFAIGGINETNINKIIDTGASRVAIVRAIIDSKDPCTTTKQLKEHLQGNVKLNA